VGVPVNADAHYLALRRLAFFLAAFFLPAFFAARFFLAIGMTSLKELKRLVGVRLNSLAERPP
jgi:hypothetical protein